MLLWHVLSRGVFVNSAVIDELDDIVCTSVRVGDVSDVVVGVCLILSVGLELGEIIVDCVFDTNADCVCDIGPVSVCCTE